MIRVDNLGAIFMAGIITAARHGKHVDIQCMENLSKEIYEKDR